MSLIQFQNTDHFEILRSSNGTDFNEMIGTVTAKGNSNSLVNYSFTDNAPINGWNFYKLKLIDKDDKVPYSNVARVQTNDNLTDIHLYPNPAKSVVKIDYEIEAAGIARCMVTDARGTVVRDIKLSVQAGRNVQNIDVSNFAPGTYTLRISSNGRQVTSTFIKL